MATPFFNKTELLAWLKTIATANPDVNHASNKIRVYATVTEVKDVITKYTGPDCFLALEPISARPNTSGTDNNLYAVDLVINVLVKNAGAGNYAVNVTKSDKCLQAATYLFDQIKADYYIGCEELSEYIFPQVFFDRANIEELPDGTYDNLVGYRLVIPVTAHRKSLL